VAETVALKLVTVAMEETAVTEVTAATVAMVAPEATAQTE
jgi:hypothetical protein